MARAESVFVQQALGDFEGGATQAGCNNLRPAWTRRCPSVLPAESNKFEALASTGSVVKRTADCVRFKRSEMLRGTRISGVLQGFGRIFANSEGSASTFELSAPVNRIDVFISHNWSTRRLDKFGALALYFNCSVAFMAMWVCAVATVPLSSLGFPFTLGFESSYAGAGISHQSIGANALGPVVLLLALAGGHEVSGRLGCKGPVAFLDKTCIHQTDDELKQEGIASLAAFLANSRVMLIVYSCTYLQKLWTVYELASSLLLHPGRRVVLIPCFMPKLILCGLILYTMILTGHRMLLLCGIASVLKKVPGMANATTIATFCIIFFVGYALYGVLEGWASDRAEIKEVVAGFTIRNAVCFDEKDRVVVQSNIVSFVRDLGLVVADEGEEAEDFEDKALDAFDELVREEVPPALLVSFGRQGIPYRYLLIMFSCTPLRGVDVVGPQILKGEPLHTWAYVAVEYLTIWLAVCPLATAVLYCVAARNAVVRSATEQNAPSAKRKRRRRTFREKACLSFQFTLVMVGSCIVWFSLTSAGDLATNKDTTGAVIFFALVSVLFLLVAFAYRPVPVRRADRASLSAILAAACRSREFRL